MGKPFYIALAATLLAGPVAAQGLDTLPEDQQVGYCATYFMSVLEHEGVDAADTTQSAAEAFLSVAAQMTDQDTDTLRANLAKGTAMLVPFMQVVESNPTAKNLIDMSAQFCTDLAANYDETREAQP